MVTSVTSVPSIKGVGLGLLNLAAKTHVVCTRHCRPNH